jgi:predicted mannosyl-3-phosphoglycerate phosphatase (HAD superfamily)
MQEGIRLYLAKELGLDGSFFIDEDGSRVYFDFIEVEWYNGIKLIKNVCEIAFPDKLYADEASYRRGVPIIMQ